MENTFNLQTEIRKNIATYLVLTLFLCIPGLLYASAMANSGMAISTL